MIYYYIHINTIKRYKLHKLNMEEETENIISFENAYQEVQNQPFITMISHDFPVFDVLFEVLNNFVNEITLDFLDDGIRIMSINDHQTVLLYVKLKSDSFAHYQTTQSNNNISFDLTALCNFIKLAKKEKQIKFSSTFTIRVDDKKIYFDFTDEYTKTTITYGLTKLDIDNNAKTLPKNTTFTKAITIETSTLFSTCKVLKKYSNYANFSCSKDKFTIDSGEVLKTFNNNDFTRILSPNDNNDIVDAILFDLEHLVKLEKVSSLVSECQLYLKNAYPLFVNVSLGTIGKLLIGMSPIDNVKN